MNGLLLGVIIVLSILLLIAGVFWMVYSSKPALPPYPEYDEERHQNYQITTLSSYSTIILTFLVLFLFILGVNSTGESRGERLLRMWRERTGRNSFSSI